MACSKTNKEGNADAAQERIRVVGLRRSKMTQPYETKKASFGTLIFTALCERSIVKVFEKSHKMICFNNFTESE